MTLVFSLIGGLLVAIAIQLVFANLGIALGLTVLDWSPKNPKKRMAGDRKAVSKSDRADLTNKASTGDTEPTDKQALPITHFLGFGVAVGFSAVIFIATLLSVEFAQLMEPRRGIVFGLIFWSTYWLLFIWLSSTTIAGIADSLLGTALEGGKQLVSTLRQSVKKTDTPDLEQPSPEQSMLQDLVAEVSQLVDVQEELPTLLANQRETLLKEICDRTALSTAEAETVVNELNISEPEPTPTTPISTTPISTTPISTTPISTPPPTLMSQLDLPSWQQILRRTLSKVDLSDWDVETILQQIPIDDPLNTRKLRHQTAQLVGSAIAVLPQAQSPADAAPHANSSAQADSPARPSPSPMLKAVQAKIISFCRYTNTDLLTPEKLAEKVVSQREDYGLLEDKDIANMPLDIDAIKEVLSRRQKLSPTNREALIETLQVAWPTAQPVAATEDLSADFPTAEDAEFRHEKEITEGYDFNARAIAEKAYQTAYKTVEEQFKTIDWSKASLEDIKPEISLLLEQLERKETLRSLDWSALTSRLQLPATTRTEFTTWLQTAWNAKVQELRPAATRSAQQLSEQLTDQITHLLHHQEKSELEPAKIASRLTHVVTKTLSALPNPSEILDSTHLSDLLDKDTWEQKLWDKAVWQQALEKRKDLTTEEIQQILDWGEQVWRPKAQQVGGWLQAAQAEISEHLSLPDIDLPDIDLPDISLSEGSPLAEVRQQIVEKVAAAQEKVSDRAAALKADLQAQADAARRQVAIAAWWLFIALVTSGSAAASAGYLAAIY